MRAADSRASKYTVSQVFREDRSLAKGEWQEPRGLGSAG